MGDGSTKQFHGLRFLLSGSERNSIMSLLCTEEGRNKDQKYFRKAITSIPVTENEGPKYSKISARSVLRRAVYYAEQNEDELSAPAEEYRKDLATALTGLSEAEMIEETVWDGRYKGSLDYDDLDSICQALL